MSLQRTLTGAYALDVGTISAADKPSLTRLRDAISFESTDRFSARGVGVSGKTLLCSNRVTTCGRRWAFSRADAINVIAWWAANQTSLTRLSRIIGVSSICVEAVGISVWSQASAVWGTAESASRKENIVRKMSSLQAIIISDADMISSSLGKNIADQLRIREWSTVWAGNVIVLEGKSGTIRTPQVKHRVHWWGCSVNSNGDNLAGYAVKRIDFKVANKEPMSYKGFIRPLDPRT